MLTFANAKINLGLFVTEKRADGYHNLQTVFYPIQIRDAVELIDAPETSCLIEGITIPGNATDNLCVKAYKGLQKDFELPNQQIVLLKNIPVGAGLGGGSADAAFTVKLANQKFNLGLSDEQMEAYVRPLGADCAFFIKNKPVYAFGKGDEFKPIDVSLADKYLVLVKPDIHVATADAYRYVQPKSLGQDLQSLIGLPIEQWQQVLKNDFEPSVFKTYPQIDEIKTQLYRAGAIFALMSGSGSSVFGIFNKPVQLQDLETRHQVFYNV